MGLRSWWAKDRAAARKGVMLDRLNRDQTVISQVVPELLGMSEVEGMAYTLGQIDQWKTIASPEQLRQFGTLGNATLDHLAQFGVTPPYWNVLLVLRLYQQSLGLDVPPARAFDWSAFLTALPR